MRKTAKFAFILACSLAISSNADKKEAKKQTEEAPLTYNLEKLDLIDPYLIIARRATLPTISVLMPKDLIGFRSSFPYSVQSSPEFNRIFIFPSGFGLDTSFIGSALARRQGQRDISRRRGDDSLGQLLGPVVAEYEARQRGEYSLGYDHFVGSPLQSILQNELTMALAKSGKFNPLVPRTGPMSQDLRTIEVEKRIGVRRTERPLDKMPTADFFLGSSIGVKGMEVNRSSFSGDNEITDFIESIFLGNTSYDKRQRISRAVDIFRSLFRFKDEILVSVVVNLYIADDRRIIAAGNGLGISKVDLSKGLVFAGIQREKIKTEDFLIDGVKKAVQDAFNNLSVLSAAPASRSPSQPVPQAAGRPTAPEQQSPQAPPGQTGQKITIARGTPIVVRLASSLSTDSAYPGQEFTAYLDGPLVAEGFVIAERNAEVRGVIVESREAGRTKEGFSLSLKLVQMKASNGMKVNIATDVLKVEGKTGSETVLRFYLAEAVHLPR